MKGTLICWDGRRLALPDLLSWRLEYAAGVPCDGFSLECLWEPGQADVLAEAVRFTAEEDGETVFTGVVDECERGWDERGGTLSVSGRGMAALLLDNEALSADYQTATLEDILRDHVSPYGIRTARTAKLPAVPGFSVAAGSSEWQVLYTFARYYGGVTPRFDRLGRLIVAPWDGGTRRVLGAAAPVTALRCRERRYGVLSEVLARDRTSEEVQRVRNEDFASRGGQCRRVLTMPGRSSYQAMRYSAQYQLDRSARLLRRLEVELAGTFRAWPGDLVELAPRRDVGRGLWRVAECVHALDAAGRRTRLVLGGPEADL